MLIVSHTPTPYVCYERKLNAGPRYSTVVQVGDSSAIPPVAVCSSSVTEGMAPLDVTIDMTGSYDEDGSLASKPYCIECMNGMQFCQTGQYEQDPIHTCTFTDPGTVHLKQYVKDDEGYLGESIAFYHTNISNIITSIITKRGLRFLD